MNNIKKSLEKLRNAMAKQTIPNGIGACCFWRNGVLNCSDNLMLNDCQGFNGVFYSGKTCSQNPCGYVPQKFQ
jgi:hypothetical protein